MHRRVVPGARGARPIGDRVCAICFFLKRGTPLPLQRTPLDSHANNPSRLSPHQPKTSPNTKRKQEDEYEEDEYEEVFAEEGATGGGDAGVEALDDSGANDGDGDGDEEDAGGEEGDDEDEDQDEYEEEDEESEEEEGEERATQSAEEEEEEQAGGALVAAAAAGPSSAAAAAAAAEATARKANARPAALLRRLKGAATALRPANLLSTAGAQLSRARRLAWRLEDAGVFSARLAARLARRAARPALVAIIAHRAMSTLSESRWPAHQAARLPRSQQQDYLFQRAMGRDWRETMRRDLLDAVAEVDEGLDTEEINFEKRALQAAVLRRLEVEEWDKQRMRHYYYGLYGLGPWYWDMEERLHNPLFIASRGWNQPVEAWVGRNKVYPRDVAASRVTGDGVTDALRALGEARGAPVPQAVARRVAERETLSRGDKILTDRALVSALTAHLRGPDGGPLSDAEAALAARAELEATRERRRRAREAEEREAAAA